ncbi:magnesium/cobalt transporter CorA [Lignipirellula cremea]|uniref:Magnesium transport protein CorA n=1 Tax=Lignipirellula cremea TaxID=2528010 RepID=A0A518DZR7_9BACT|nr:magnesium/cobalt transporter CorA [Lignipirellula cremea]QDU97336.1 Magnesium transport protein CorA [Lignipirellula cremea]
MSKTKRRIFRKPSRRSRRSKQNNNPNQVKPAPGSPPEAASANLCHDHGRAEDPGDHPGNGNGEAPRKAIVRFTGFGSERVVEETNPRIDTLKAKCQQFTVVWIDVEGVNDAEVNRQLAQAFHLHPLAMEDVVNTHQRAKVDPYHEHLFIVTRKGHFRERAETEQVAMFLGPNFVISFQEMQGDSFEPVRDRIRKSSGRLRQAGADFLAYTLIDSVVDSYFPLLDRYADRLDGIEDDIAQSLSSEVTARIHETRNDLLLLRRTMRPHRDAINELIRDEHDVISENTRVFLRDCADHTSQLIDLLETHREVCTDLRDYYLSLVSNRMNEVMKMLTIIATIFIPLSFVTGLYGMNFNTELPGNMPELNWPYAYVGALGLMATVAGSLLYYFYRKGWLSSDEEF